MCVILIYFYGSDNEQKLNIYVCDGVCYISYTNKSINVTMLFQTSRYPCTCYILGRSIEFSSKNYHLNSVILHCVHR